MTETVRDVARHHFGCETLEGVEVENQPTSAGACWGSHWEQRRATSQENVAGSGSGSGGGGSDGTVVVRTSPPRASTSVPEQRRGIRRVFTPPTKPRRATLFSFLFFF